MKKRRLVYRSPGTDDIQIVCGSVEEAVNCFRADAEVLLHDGESDYQIDLMTTDMTDEEVAAIPEV